MKFIIPLASAAFALVLVACEGGDSDGPIAVDPVKGTCESSDQCSEGLICSGGACVIGACDPLLEQACDVEGLDSVYCCKPWELCAQDVLNLDFQCDDDPNFRGIGCRPDEPDCRPCEVDADCPTAGQFCTGATCLDATGRADCTSSFQCGGGERCDRTVFLCVPDRGGCTFCGADFPELCCEDGQICVEQTGFCEEIPDAECTESADCLPGLFCDDLQRCVQCVVEEDCGPGLLCDTGEGECYSDGLRCTVDDDCDGNKRCAPDTQECVVPECENDSACTPEDSRERCDVGQFRCFLPPAECEETDEDNDDTGTATPMTDGISYGGVLCRDDTDVLSFPVRANKRYTATIDFGGSGQPGMIGTMLDTAFIVESAATMTATQASIQVAGVTTPGESGFFYVKVQGNNDDRDQWSYSVTIAEDEPSAPADCTDAGQVEEPNDTFETATLIDVSDTTIFSRCGLNDVDFYRIAVPPLSGIEVLVSNYFNAEGNLNVELFKAPNTGSRVANATTTNNLERVAGPEGVVEYFVKVALGNSSGAVTDQTYAVTPTIVPRPANCDDDINEDDSALADAHELTLVTPPAGTPGVIFGVTETLMRCNPQDTDLFRFSMPPNLGGVVLLRFTHSEGDMALDLLDASTGTTLDTSNVSNVNSDPDEQVEVPGSATETIEYIARARLAGTSGGTLGQRYSIEVQTFDNSQCIASEPSGGDNVFGDGRCIGSYTEDPDLTCVNDATRISEPMLAADLDVCSSAPEGTIPGCGRICGNDDFDWYRVAPIHNDAVLHATLDYDVADGALALVRGVLNGTTNNVTETTITDTDNDGHVEFSFPTPRTGGAKEYGVKVKGQGTTGHQVQLYALNVEVGGECTDDVNDVGALVNEKPVDAEIVRPNPQSGANFTFNGTGLSRCTGDIDVYEFFSFEDEEVRVTITQADTSPSGLIAELGVRPANLNNPAVLAPPAIATAGGGALVFNNPETQQLYVTVKVPTGVIVTGAYTLTITTTP